MLGICTSTPNLPHIVYTEIPAPRCSQLTASPPDSQGLCIGESGPGARSAPSSQAVAPIVDPDDLHVVQQPTQDRHGEDLVAREDLRPIPHVLIRGEHDRAVFVAGRDQVEEEVRLHSVQRPEARLVDDEERAVEEALRRSARARRPLAHPTSPVQSFAICARSEHPAAGPVSSAAWTRRRRATPRPTEWRRPARSSRVRSTRVPSATSPSSAPRWGAQRGGCHSARHRRVDAGICPFTRAGLWVCFYNSLCYCLRILIGQTA